MKWKKHGRICSHETLGLPWFKKNSMVPVPMVLDAHTIRLYMTMCDADNAGRVGYIDVDADNPTHILNYSRAPVLDIGMPGYFDDSGVLPSSLVKKDGKLYLFYSAYQRLGKVPYSILSGIAVSEDKGETFASLRRVPILERREGEQFIRSAAFCMQEDGYYRMWYSSGTSWTHNTIKDVPAYELKTMTSSDLLEWRQEPVSSIKLQSDEFGLTVPSVWKSNGLYKMIYSIRSISKGYHLGYAESTSGAEFVRKDDLMEISVSKDGWDSEMICFGNRLEHNNKTYLFYCGNHYGMAGMGYAELVE